MVKNTKKKRKFFVGRFIIFLLFLASCVVFWFIIDSKYKGFIKTKTDYMKNVMIDLGIRKDDFYNSNKKSEQIYLGDKEEKESDKGGTEEFLEEITSSAALKDYNKSEANPKNNSGKTEKNSSEIIKTIIESTKKKEEKPLANEKENIKAETETVGEPLKSESGDGEFYSKLINEGESIKKKEKTASEPEKSVKNKGYYLQVGVFKQKANVDFIMKKLSGYNVKVIETPEGYSKIVAGSGLSKDEAQKMSSEIENMLGKEYKPMLKSGE